MKRTISTLMMASAALAVGMALMPLDAVAKKPSPYWTVNCDEGGSVQAAIEATEPWKPLRVDITGVCREEIYIARDDVKLRGTDENAAIAPSTESAVYVVGGQRIVIEKLTLSGPEGALVTDSAFVTLRDVTLEGSYNGIDAVDGSNIVIEDSRVRNNELDGILLEKGGTLSMSNTVVSGNERGGVRLNKNSSGVISDSEISGNLSGFGVSISDSSSVHIKGATLINGNGSNGISVVMHSNVRIFSDPVISGNGQSGVFLAHDSGGELIGQVTIGGNTASGVECADEESSVYVHDATNIQAISCTGF